MRGAPSLQELFGITDVMEFQERQAGQLGSALSNKYAREERERLIREERRRQQKAKDRAFKNTIIGGGLGAIFAPVAGLGALEGGLTGAKMGAQMESDPVGAATTGLGAYLGGQQRAQQQAAQQQALELEKKQAGLDMAKTAAEVYDLTGQFPVGYAPPAQQGTQLPTEGTRPLIGMTPKEARKIREEERKEAAEIRKEERQRTERSKQQKLKLKPQVDAAVANIKKSRERIQNVLEKPGSGNKPALEESSGNPWNLLMSKYPGSIEYDFAADIKQIEAANAINGLMEIKRSSPTGGALGSVTEGELAILKDMAANLSLGQSPNQLRKRLETFDNELSITLGKIEGFEEAVEGDPMGLR